MNNIRSLMGERVPEYLINNKRRKVVQVVPVALATPPSATRFACRAKLISK